jgi:hypothetical protein
VELDTSFDSLWHSHDDFEFGERPADVCPYAARFGQWADELVANAIKDPDVVGINQSKLLLQDKYFEWRAAVPKAHRNHIGAAGHTCIFQVFEEAYRKLKVVELSLTPPMLFLPSPPPPTSRPQIAGIFIGEET